MSTLATSDQTRLFKDKDIQEWLQQDAEVGGVQEISDKDIIDSVTKPSDPAEECEDEDDDDDEVKEKVSWSKAVSSLETFLDFAESNPSFTINEIMNYHIILKEVYKKPHQSIKQADIRDMFKRAKKKKSPTQENDPRPRPQPQRHEMDVEMSPDSPEACNIADNK